MSPRPHALITGASSGIGQHLAQTLAQQGYSLYLNGRHQGRLEQVREHCLQAAATSGDQAPQVNCFVGDLTQEGVPLALAQKAEEVTPVTHLVHAAGIGFFGSPEQHSTDVLRRLFDINFFAGTELTHAILPHFRKRQKGHLLYVLSVAAKRPFFNVCGYTASKYALRGYAEALRQDLRKTSIDITCAMPIATRTPFWEHAGYENWEATHRNTAVQEAQEVGEALAQCLSKAPREWFPDVRSRVLDLGQRIAPTLIEWLNARGTPKVQPIFKGNSGATRPSRQTT